MRILFVDTLKTRLQNKEIEEMLLLRAWIFHSLYTINRILALITKISPMFHEKCIESDHCPDYNRELLDPYYNYVKYTLGALMGVGLILDVLAKKFRFLAHSFVYLESIFSVIQ